MTIKDGHNEFGGWIIHLEAGIDADPRGYDMPAATYDGTTVYDDSTSMGTWETLDCQVTRVTASHGGTLGPIPGMRAELGQLTASLYDPGRKLDPTATAFELLTRPGAPVRLVAIEPRSLARHVMWTGISETFEHNLLTGEGELVASDLIALFTGVTVADWPRPAENSDQRIAAVLGVMPTPVPVSFEGIPTPLAAVRFSGDLWQSAVVSTGEAEQSIVWVDRLGRLRRTDVNNLGEVLDAVDCDDVSSNIVYTEASSSVDDDLLTNRVLADRVGLPESLASRDPRAYSNPTSVSYYGPHTLTETGLALRTDTAVADWAARVLDLRSVPKATLTGLSATVSDLMPWAARTVPYLVDLEVADVLDVHLASRGEPERWLVAVAGIQHTITPDSWAVEIEVVDGPSLALNFGYDDPSSLYETSAYSRVPGYAGPTAERIRDALIRVLSQEVTV